MDPVHCSADCEDKAKHWDADGSEEAARAPGPGSYEHQPAGQLNAANCAAQQHTAYVMFDGPIETGFPHD